nr:ParB N-terminal domain-containing protein [Dehalococcoidales bacterium]
MLKGTEDPAAPEVAAVWIPIADLQPWDKNPRKNDAAVEKVADSIRRFGFGSPILARRNGEVIAGH